MDDITPEIWLPVPGYVHYEASNLGQVRSLRHQTPAGTRGGQVLRGSLMPDGRRAISLVRDGVVTRMYRYQVIMLAFVGPCPPGLEVCHADGDPGNDALSNLRYDTHQANQTDIGKYHLPLERRLRVEELECEIGDCREPQLARKMCSRHYSRWYRTGSPHVVHRTPRDGLSASDIIIPVPAPGKRKAAG